MFISDEIVFIELHKTACTHIDNLLSQIVRGRIVGKHNRAPNELFNGRRQFLGSVRNPWEWYVSLWAFGCSRQGGIYKHVTNEDLSLKGIHVRHGFLNFLNSMLAKSTRDPGKWQDAYEDVNDPSCFRRWLALLHEPQRNFDFGEDYALTPMHNFAGLLTYRYFYLFCSKAGESRPFDNLHSFEDLSHFNDKRCIIDSFIRNEHLEEDFIQALVKAGINDNDRLRKIVFNQVKTNTSSHDSNISLFYDRETDAIIHSREKFIINKFGYTSPYNGAS